MSSITQTRAEAQKLIKQYNKLQAEAKTAEPEEALLKAARAEKLVSKINTLQSALNKTKDRDAQVKQTPATNKKASTPSEAGTFSSTQSVGSTDEKRLQLEERIGRIENAQQRTRAEIEQLNIAKAEFSRLKQEAEKKVGSERRTHDLRQPQAQELAKLKEQISQRDEQYQSLKKELNGVLQQTQKETDLLKQQRDEALKRQKHLEKEKMDILRYGEGNRGFLNGLLAGAGLGILGLVALAVVIFKTPWLDSVVCRLKNSPTCSFAQQSTITTNHVTTEPPVPAQEKPPAEQ